MCVVGMLTTAMFDEACGAGVCGARAVAGAGALGGVCYGDYGLERRAPAQHALDAPCLPSTSRCSLLSTTAEMYLIQVSKKLILV